MKRYVVLAHKLIEFDIVGIMPPLLPLIRIVRSDRNIAYTRVEPHVHDLVLITLLHC